MKVKTWIKYEEAYVPPKCRKPRYKELEEYIYPELNEVNMEALQLAFEDRSYEGKGKIYAYSGKLWAEVKRREEMLDSDAEKIGATTALEAFLYWKEHSSNFFFFDFDRKKGIDTSKEAVEKTVKAVFDSYLLVDGVLYKECLEPMYVVNTFGLGFNHGGTAMFVEYGYNPNISNESYFNALDGKKAVNYANATAAARGDTKDVGKFSADILKVYMPELVTRNPKCEHGTGNPLMKMFESMVQASENKGEAALMVTAAALAEI